MDCLIGHTGFVGGAISRQHRFDAHFNSATIGQSAGARFDSVVCAAAPGSMFEANRQPERDHERLAALMAQLGAIHADRMILISTIAVLRDFKAVDETTNDFAEQTAYGRHRRELEEFVVGQFRKTHIIRLPALFGPGLRKNFVFDVLNPMPSMLSPADFETMIDALAPDLRQNAREVYTFDPAAGLHTIDRGALDRSGRREALEAAALASGLAARRFTHPGSTFQYYDMARLWDDISVAIAHDIPVLHLSPAPVAADRIHRRLTGTEMPPTPPAAARAHHENMRTRHAALWGRDDGYLASADEVLAALETFARRWSTAP